MMKLIKNNLFATLITIIYIMLALIAPSYAISGIANSGYYIKEMLMIMPAIFVLTALLDRFVPKDTIIKYLGKQAKTKGMLLSFVLGSISAGPIYAAFPFCVMLYNKGATIRNIVIILSSWAVIKIPMLINEAKFLGIKFMVVRWFLTIIAIIIFSAIADKMIKKIDANQVVIKGLSINQDACMGCTICSKHHPSIFAMENKKAKIIKHDDLDKVKIASAIEKCPVKAITYNI